MRHRSTPRRPHGTTELIMAARCIVRGDVSAARDYAQGKRLATVAEARALAGACSYAKRRYGARLRWTEFISG